jgi:hypothetical protein
MHFLGGVAQQTRVLRRTLVSLISLFNKEKDVSNSCRTQDGKYQSESKEDLTSCSFKSLNSSKGCELYFTSKYFISASG